MKGINAEEPAQPPANSASAASSRWLTTAEAAERFNVNRKTLDALARGNLDLPGGPVAFGGKKRLHLRWPPEGIEDWMRAIRARAEEAAKPAPPRRRKPRTPRHAVGDGPVDWTAVRRRLLGSGP